MCLVFLVKVDGDGPRVTPSGLLQRAVPILGGRVIHKGLVQRCGPILYFNFGARWAQNAPGPSSVPRASRREQLKPRTLFVLRI